MSKWTPKELIDDYQDRKLAGETIAEYHGLDKADTMSDLEDLHRLAQEAEAAALKARFWGLLDQWREFRQDVAVAMDDLRYQQDVAETEDSLRFFL